VLEDQEEHAMSSVTTQLLAEIPLFSAMDEEERGELRLLMTERLFQPGEVVMKAGEPEGTFHIIDQGEVELWLMDTEGKRWCSMSFVQESFSANCRCFPKRHVLPAPPLRTYSETCREQKRSQC
jgi:hypothetical protein